MAGRRGDLVPTSPVGTRRTTQRRHRHHQGSSDRDHGTHRCKRRQPARQLPLHPGRFLVDQPNIETWFGIITRRAIRRGTFTSIKALVKRIRYYIAHWNADARPFA